MTKYFAQDPTSIGLSVSAIVWREGEILLMKRSDNGYWGLPGGFVELGESVAEATHREVAEETGYSIELGALVGVYSDPAQNVVDYDESEDESKAGCEEGSKKGKESRGRVQIVNLCFHAVALEAGTATTPEETLEMRFFAADELPEPFVPIHRIRIEDGLAGRAEAAIR